MGYALVETSRIIRSPVRATTLPDCFEVRLEVQVHVPDGVGDDVVRTMTENAKTLKFDAQGFERE